MLARRQLIVPALAAAILALAVPPAALAQAPLPIGESKGVRAERVKGQITITFTKDARRLHRRLAGRLIVLTCTNVPPDRGLRGPEVTTGGDSLVRVPAKRRRFRTGEGSRPLDYCRLSLPAKRVTRDGVRMRVSQRVLVAIPLTRAGAVQLDEEEKAASVAGMLLLVKVLAERRKIDTWPTPADLIAYLTRLSRPAGRRVVALPSAAATPPAGKIGYWSDGGENGAIVVLSRAGRRLFLELGADDVLRTNLTEYLFADR